LQDVRHAGRVANDPAMEKGLADLGLPSLNASLGYWSEHNRNILKTVPAEKMLVIRTEQITDSMGEIAAFLDVPFETLTQKKSHMNKAKGKSDVLLRMDPAYLDAVIREHCQDLIDEFFPDYCIPAG
jgi:hypothetical protein